jgi:hypothetical protein
MSGDSAGRWSQAAKLAGWALLMAPLTILLHELGHFAVAAGTGWPAQLRPMSVSGGAEGGQLGPGLVALQAGAGLIVTVIVTLVAGLLYRGDRDRLWALAIAIAAVSRMFVTTSYLTVRAVLWVTGQPFGGKPNFDEHNVAVALGLPPVLLALVTTIFLFAVVYWLMRAVPRGRRLLFAIALVAGTALGTMAWGSLMPPVLLSVGSGAAI